MQYTLGIAREWPICVAVWHTARAHMHTSPDSFPITHHNTADLPHGLTLAVRSDHITIRSQPTGVCLSAPKCVHGLGSSRCCCYCVVLSVTLFVTSCKVLKSWRQQDGWKCVMDFILVAQIYFLRKRSCWAILGKLCEIFDGALLASNTSTVCSQTVLCLRPVELFWWYTVAHNPNKVSTNSVKFLNTSSRAMPDESPWSQVGPVPTDSSWPLEHRNTKLPQWNKLLVRL